MMKRTALLALVGLVVLAAAGAADDGYTFGNGFYWRGGRAFSRQLVTSAGYWHCGQYYPGYQSYQYYEAPPAYTPPAVTNNTYPAADWRAEAVKIAKARLEQQQFMEAMKALGLADGVGGYAQAPGAVQAATQYGIRQESLKVYAPADVNLNELFLAAAQLTQGAQKLAGDANAGFQTTVQQQADGRNREAEILAKASLIKAALSGPAEVEYKSTRREASAGLGGGPPGTAGVDPPQHAPPAAPRAAAFRQQACAACHTGAAAKGGFDIATYDQLTPESRLSVLQRLLTDDASKVMPRDKSGQGRRLTQQEIRDNFPLQ